MIPLAAQADLSLPSTAAELSFPNQATLRRSEMFYRTVLESLAEGVVITDASNRIFYANGVASEITGYAPHELLGADLNAVLFAGLPDTPEIPLGECAQCSEVEIRSRDGQPGWVYLRRTPYRNEVGEVAGTITALSCIRDRKYLEFEVEALQAEIRQHAGSIIGQSAALMKILSQITTVAPTEANVLITGESGTGKELVAHAIHQLSARKDHALIRVNCASIPKDLFESEFFGHVRGAFTSAVKDRVGRFELAHQGTLFLDEIGEIPLELQSKLLRVLQEGTFERLGDERTRTVDVRIIAATNRDLLAEAKAGRFRLDLYYRLSVFPIDVPPLRDRRDDIPLLAQHFAKDAARRLGVSPPRWTKSDLRQLKDYDWPGNVRELQNVIERAVILSREGRIDLQLPQRSLPPPDTCPGAMADDTTTPLTLDELAVREREIVLSALQRQNWKIYGADGAAALLNVKPTTLVSMMKRLNLQRPRIAG
jgi:PAS domain S-box-containing protein